MNHRLNEEAKHKAYEDIFNRLYCNILKVEAKNKTNKLHKMQATEISKDDLKGVKDGDFIKIII